MNGSIDRMRQEISVILDRRIHSIWLYGSVVLNDFRLGWSDIDIIVFTNRPVTESEANKLLTLRQRMSDIQPENPYYRCFEGVIVNIDEYLSGGYTRLVYWGSSSQRIDDHYDMDAFSRYGLAKYGISVYGSDDRSFFRIPERRELISAVKDHYDTIRKYAVRTGESIYSCGWILDIARCIYTLRYGSIIGKTQAAEWALREHIFSDDAPLKMALEIRRTPLEYKNNDSIKEWLGGLGDTVQRYADVLERELNCI